MDQKKRDKIAWIFAIVLTPLLAYLLVVNVFIGSRRRAPRQPSAGTAPAAPAPLPAATPRVAPPAASPARRVPEDTMDPETAAAQKVIAAETPVRNPFAASGSETSSPARATVGQGSSLNVSAVILSPGSGKRMAMINGRMFEEGDQVGDWTILKVSPREVIFGRGSQRRTVSVK